MFKSGDRNDAVVFEVVGDFGDVCELTADV